MTAFTLAHLWIVFIVIAVVTLINTILAHVCSVNNRKVFDRFEYQDIELKSAMMKRFDVPLRTKLLKTTTLLITLVSAVIYFCYFYTKSVSVLKFLTSFYMIPQIVMIIEHATNIVNPLEKNPLIEGATIKIDKTLLKYEVRSKYGAFIYMFKAGCVLLIPFIIKPTIYLFGAILGLFLMGIRLNSIYKKSITRIDNNQEKPTDEKPMQCKKCGKTYDKTWTVCLQCNEKLTLCLPNDVR